MALAITRDPVIVTGCARSGTSLTMGILARCGLQLGNVCGATPANPRGQYENRGIIQECVKPYLKGLGADPMGQGPLPAESDVGDSEWPSTCILDVATRQGIDLTRPWGFKAVKACLMWQPIAQGFPNATWIIVRRDQREIARSCLRTPFMKRYDNEEDWIEHWVKVHEARFESIKQNCRAIEIWPEEMVQGNYDSIRKVVRWLGLDWPESEIEEFINPEMFDNGR